ncbi:MAG: ATP-dependent DNA helicase RecG [Candidatus Binatia bacterium]
MKLEDPLQYIKGVGPRRAATLLKSGFCCAEDLLFHLPFRYEDRRVVSRVSELRPGGDATVVGEIEGVRLYRTRGRNRRQILEATLADGSGWLGLVWFHQGAYFRKRLEGAGRWLVHGRIEAARKGGLQIVHPELEVVDGQEDFRRVVPVYQKPSDIPVSTMRRLVATVVENCAGQARPAIPAGIEERLGLMPLEAALEYVHRPPADSDHDELTRFSTPAHRRLIFEELFALQTGVSLRRTARENEPGRAMPEVPELRAAFLDSLPFQPTRAQRRVIDEVAADMAAPRPMNRLVQGDVGSGKTLVAFAVALQAVRAGYQVALMAPTELLAEQHFRTLEPWAVEQGVTAELLTGSLPQSRAAAVRQGLLAGEVDFVVGTHALVQSTTEFAALGLAVIDEQHRFGVMQRATLKEAAADTLLLSATPIPRTLSLTLFGDIDVSILDEMPPGRKPVLTKVVRQSEMDHLYRRMALRIAQGQQCYVVYPLVEESETLDLENATSMAERLQAGPFRDWRVGLVHGRMKSAEKTAVMRSFKRGDIHVLVATTVIEVGIDVPNATIMVVVHADRFGLAQLHQLRGRVGRGGEQAYCCLVADQAQSRDAFERLKVMERSSDGFEIAEADLKLRGPGEYLGTRQSGLPAFRAANLVRDVELLELARDEAQTWLSHDPQLRLPESGDLKKTLERRWGERLVLAEVG